MIEREVKRSKVNQHYRNSRKVLKETVYNIHLEYDIRMDAQRKLQALPRNASPVRMQRRCHLCGRAHGVYRKFGLCRLHLRQYAMDGKVPGVVKSSW